VRSFGLVIYNNQSEWRAMTFITLLYVTTAS